MPELEDISPYQNLVFEKRQIDWALAHVFDSAILPATSDSRDTVVGEFTDRSLRGTLFVSDAGQNLYLGWGYNLAHSNLGGASFLRKDGTGAVTGAWTTNAPDDFKPDDLGGNVFGPDLGMMWLTHEPISSDTRRNRVYIGLLHDVVLVPYAAGVPQLGGYVPRSAFGGGSPAPGPSEPVDYAQIERIAVAAATGQMNRLIGLMGEGSLPEAARFRQMVEDKVKNALEESLSVDMLAVFRDDAFFAQFNSMIGQSTAKVLIEFGVIPLSRIPPTSWVRTLDGFPWGATG